MTLLMPTSYYRILYSLSLLKLIIETVIIGNKLIRCYTNLCQM